MTEVHRGSQRRTVWSKLRIERHAAGRDEYVIDAVELLKQCAGAGFVGDIERDRARSAPELRLGRLQALARASGYYNPSAFGLRGLGGRQPDTATL